ncbi:MAG: primosomal protein N' [Burkholderiaceae bacterium]
MSDKECPAAFVSVIIDAPVTQPLDYGMPAEIADRVKIGLRCVVPLGRRSVIGLITQCKPESAIESSRIRSVARVLDEVSPLDAHWLELTHFAADYYQQAWGEVALPALPSILRSVPGPRAAQSLARLRKVRPQVVPTDAPTIELNTEQRNCIEQLAAAGGFVPTLLFGITGSGKTEVYLATIERRLAADPKAQVLLLVPEINLTPQLEALVRARFAHVSVVVLHSGLAEGERAASWLAAHEGRAQIVVGTRLAIFASLPRLSLIIVDEEHDSSYKAGEGVRYSARDLALKRAQLLDVPIVLGSATPSLESWARAQQGRLQLLSLTRRASSEASVLPLEIVDTKAHPPTEGIAGHVATAIAETVERGEQALVFLNRRGYAPVVACEACGWLSTCPRCSAFAVFHKLDRTLRCHHCGWSAAVPRACPTCGNQALRGVGGGTQRLEERLQSLMPGARIARIDRDSTRRRGAAEQAFDAVHRGEIDVMVGTQMIAKGHDFQRVTLVAVINPDGQLVSHDFRASERLFATLMQVAGRAGRGERAGRVIVQTRFPQHAMFVALARQDYAAFADALLAERQAAHMPPFVHQALLTSEARTMQRAVQGLSAARDVAPDNFSVRLFDPVPRALARLAGVERAQLLVEADRRTALQGFLKEWLPAVRGLKPALRWQLEVDPLEI